ncbi:MAG: hypothetical protein ACREQ5_02665 [Candidatus Dormibacteria bacterium]
MTAALTWKTRVRRETNLTSHRRIYESRCGQYRVVGCQSLFGLPNRWYALQHVEWGWDKISVHRERLAAMKACEKARQKRG